MRGTSDTFVGRAYSTLDLEYGVCELNPGWSGGVFHVFEYIEYARSSYVDIFFFLCVCTVCRVAGQGRAGGR